MTVKRSMMNLCAVCIGIPGLAAADVVSLRSNLLIYEFTEPDALSAPPAESVQDCRAVSATTLAGRAVQDAGWQVVAEIALGGKDIVTFAAGSSPDAYGVCAYSDSYLGVFEGDRIVGMLRGSDPADNTFGPLLLADDETATLFGSAFPMLPLAEIVHDNGTFTVQAASMMRAECGGLVSVAQLAGSPVGEMRNGLIALGWTPGTPAAADEIAHDMQVWGFPETASCSAAPPYYCSYVYQHPQATLEVTSIGEMIDGHAPVVADYTINCLD